MTKSELRQIDGLSIDRMKDILAAYDLPAVVETKAALRAQLIQFLEDDPSQMFVIWEE